MCDEGEHNGFYCAPSFQAFLALLRRLIMIPDSGTSNNANLENNHLFGVSEQTVYPHRPFRFALLVYSEIASSQTSPL